MRSIKSDHAVENIIIVLAARSRPWGYRKSLSSLMLKPTRLKRSWRANAL